jgi:deazaflavin-dependent oxidoreductase (nitroreductase family)
VSDWNDKIIDEFRGNGGKVGGAFQGATLLLLHTTGARTGAARVNPLIYQDLGDNSLAVFASKAGAPTNPDWYHNLVANPIVTAELGTETRAFRARVATEHERNRRSPGSRTTGVRGGDAHRYGNSGCSGHHIDLARQLHFLRADVALAHCT